MNTHLEFLRTSSKRSPLSSSVRVSCPKGLPFVLPWPLRGEDSTIPAKCQSRRFAGVILYVFGNSRPGSESTIALGTDAPPLNYQVGEEMSDLGHILFYVYLSVCLQTLT